MIPTRLVRPLVDRLVAWDRAAAMRPTRLVANSRNVAARIASTTAAMPTFLHCPVDIDRFGVGRATADYFIVASRLLPYKRHRPCIRAASLAGVRLLIAGNGPAEARCARMAKGTTTDDARLRIGRSAQRAAKKPRAAIVPAKKTSGSFRSKRRRPDGPPSPTAESGALERSSKEIPELSSTTRNSESLAGALRTFDASHFDPQHLPQTRRKVRAFTVHRTVARHRRASLPRETRRRRRRRRDLAVLRTTYVPSSFTLSSTSRVDG